MSGSHDLASLAEPTVTVKYSEEVTSSPVASAQPDIELRAPDTILGSQITQDETAFVATSTTEAQDESTASQHSAAPSDSSLHESHLWESCIYRTTTNEVFGSFAIEKERFSSFDEANAARAAAVNPAGERAADSTLPKTNEEWKPYVATLVQAMVDMSTSTETHHAKKRFENLWSTGGRVDSNGQEQVELMAWDVLEHVKAYHAVGGPVDPATRDDAIVRQGQASFMRHVMAIAAALKDNKTICFDVAKRKEIQIFVDDVEGCVKKKAAYKENNERRKKRNDGAGTSVAAAAGDGLSKCKRKRIESDKAQDEVEDKASRRKVKIMATPVIDESSQPTAVGPELSVVSAYTGTTKQDLGTSEPAWLDVQSRETRSFNKSKRRSQDDPESQLAQQSSYPATPDAEPTLPERQPGPAESLHSHSGHGVTSGCRA